MTYDALIVGAGQQGLAVAKTLKDRGCKIIVLEKDTEIGERWRRHYESLILFTPRRYSSLPGFPMPGNQDGYAAGKEFGDYLRTYARRFELPVRTSTKVERLEKAGDLFIATTHRGEYHAKNVVVAVGYGEPVMPVASAVCMHSSAYQSPKQIPGPRVLVVGNGNSASQIALELSSTKQVAIAMREMPRMVPKQFLGKSFYWWGDLFGMQRIASDSRVGRFFRREKDFVVGTELKKALQAGVLERRPGVLEVVGNIVRFEGGREEYFDDIILATGFRGDYGWLRVPGALTPEGVPLEDKGVSSVAGLYFAGLRNQLTNISSNIYGAKAVAEHIGAHLKGSD